MAQQRGQWGSRIGFILAAAGSAVGLGNIWRFPYSAGENGGGWFVLIYLLCVALVGVPIMMAEIMIGRAAQKQPVAAFHELQGGRSAWAGVGWLGMAAGFIILSYYIVVAGWAMDYTLKSVVNFARPIKAVATTEAVKYRATASLEDMRLALAEHEAALESRAAVRAIQNRARPSAWTMYDQYTAALEEAEVVDVTRVAVIQEVWDDHRDLAPAEVDVAVLTDAQDAYQQVRQRLLEKPDLREAVESVEALLPEMEEVRRDVKVAAMEAANRMDDAAVRNEAENLVRRRIIRDRVGAAFGEVAGDGWTSLFWTALFMAITIGVVAAGISGGIERACGILMPALFGLILVLVIYGMFQPGFGQAFGFVFMPDASKLHPSSVLGAMGQAFFSLSLGMGAMITYGSYQRSKDKLAGQSVTIAGLDTSVALLACLMIFPIVFSYGQEPSAGPGLVFIAMPLAFAEIGSGGMLLATMFFGLLVFAALTSSISLLEVVSSYFIDERGWTRRRAVWTIGGIIFGFGVFSAFASDPDFALQGWSASYGTDFFTTIDYLASNWMLPAGGFFIAIYAGWIMPARLRRAEIEDLSGPLTAGWLLLVRFVAPALVVVVLLQSIGILDADELFHRLVN